jgi:hypothetical protein
VFGKRTRESISVLRHAFGHRDNRKVFAWLLENYGGFFKRIDTEEQRNAHNMMVHLLENMGMTQGVNYQKLVDFVLDQTATPEEALDR